MQVCKMPLPLCFVLKERLNRKRELMTAVLLTSFPAGTPLLWTWLPWFSMSTSGLNFNTVQTGWERAKKEQQPSPEMLSLCILWNAHHLHSTCGQVVIKARTGAALRSCWLPTVPRRHGRTYFANYGFTCSVQRQRCAEWVNWHYVRVNAFM